MSSKRVLIRAATALWAVTITGVLPVAAWAQSGADSLSASFRKAAERASPALVGIRWRGWASACERAHSAGGPVPARRLDTARRTSRQRARSRDDGLGVSDRLGPRVCGHHRKCLAGIVAGDRCLLGRHRAARIADQARSACRAGASGRRCEGFETEYSIVGRLERA